MTTINPSLTPYLPASFKNADGSLKPGVDPGFAQSVASKAQEHVSHMPPAQQSLFLSLLSSATDLSPQGGTLPNQIDPKLQDLDAKSAAISQFMGLATDINILSKLMIMHANESRKDAMNQRLAAREDAKTQLMAQAGQEHQAATDMRASAVVALVMSVVSVAISFVQMGAAGAATGKASAKLNELGDAPKMSENMTPEETANFNNDKATYDRGMAKVTQLNNESTIASTKAGMTNTLGQGLSSYASTEGQAEAKEAQSQGDADGALAQDDMAKGDQAKEVFQAADDLVKQIINLLKDLKDSKAQEMASITRG